MREARASLFYLYLNHMNVFIASITNDIAEFTPEESWHCAKVLRFKAGDKVNIIDGKGKFYEGTLYSVNEKKCVAQLNSEAKTQKKRNYHLHLAIAPTKNIDRMEWMIEKAVEIGIDEITFIRCKNSERTVIKEERLIKIAESAVKQSLQAYIPKINPLISFSEAIKLKSDLKFIAFCEEQQKKHLKEFDVKNKSSLVFIGPEGDFTLDEVLLAQENNAAGITLGDNRLRTETAGLYVCNVFALL
jgi:16S rRNA (uracil1498-N3)-methyltransferase